MSFIQDIHVLYRMYTHIIKEFLSFDLHMLLYRHIRAVPVAVYISIDGFVDLCTWVRAV